MVSCEHLKKGEKFICKECGLELEVTKACDCAEEGACTEEGFACCGQPMEKR